MNTLVINLSLSTIKISVITNLGKLIYHNWLPVRTYINNEFVEQDPNEWWELLLELISTLSKNKELTNSIRFTTVTSSALCLVLLDTKGNVVNKSIMVSDKRAEKEALELSVRFPSFFRDNPGVKANASFMLPKILWLKRNKSSQFIKIDKFLSSNDFLVYKLTSKFITDYLNAEKFYYSHQTKSYTNQINSYCGIKTNNLPTVVAPGTLIGPIRSSLKIILKTKDPIMLAVSTYDAICALIGGSKYQNGELNVVSGTCSSYRMFTKSFVPLKSDVFLHQDMPSEKMAIFGGSNNLEGGVLEWAKECFYGDSFLKDNNFLYSLMQKEAQESELGARGILFIPYLLGERVPFSDPYVRGMFFGIERYHTRKDIIRSVFESVGFQARLMIDEFGKNGIELSYIILSGGVSKMPFAAKLRADIVGLPIHILSETETTSLGAYILVLRALKKIPTLAEASKFVKVKETYTPNMHNHNAYASLFVLYKELYNNNKELFIRKQKVFEHITQYRKRIMQYL